MFVIQTSVKQRFSSLLVIPVFLSSLVGAQSQLPTSPADQKQATLKAGDKRPPTSLPTEHDDEQDSKLAVYQVHRLAEKILALRSVRARAIETARLAGLLWKHDETHARSLFQKALDLTIANGNDSDAKALSILHRRVITLIARNDAQWAKRLIDSAAKRETEDHRLKTTSGANLGTAFGLLGEDPTVAVQFAERSLNGGVHSTFVDFVLTLRDNNEPEANRLFLQALNYLSQQPVVNVLEFHSLGIYLFTAPNAIHPNARVLTVVDDIFVPNITVERPGIPKALVRAYLATAADVLWRMTSDSEQRKYSYALCYMLLPKSRNVAPDLTPKLDAVMAALSPQIPSTLAKDSAYRYLNPLPTTAEEKLSNAENKPDQESRDIAYLEIALQAWRKADFKMARIAQERISDLEASQRLAAIINFGHGVWSIKQNAADLSGAEAIANRLPEGIERSILFQAIAKIQSKGPNANLTEESVDKALKSARAISDGRRPFLLLTAAAQLANLKSAALHVAMAETIRDFNSFEEAALSRLDWAQAVQIGPLNARFPLEIANVDFGFNEAFRTVALADPEAAMARAEELRHENLRAQGLVEVARAFLEKLPPKPIQK